MLWRERWPLGKRTRLPLARAGTFALFLLLVFLAIRSRPFAFLAAQLQGAGDAAPNTSSSEELLSCSENLAALLVRLEGEEDRAALSLDPAIEGWSAVEASVVARSFVGSRSVFLINKGEADGLKKGAAVVSGGRTLVGLVLNVRPHTSLVRLVTDERSRVATKTLTSRLVGVSRGTKGALLFLTFIPKESMVAVSDLVFTAGIEGTIPAGLVLGVVTDVVSQDTAAFAEASIEPIVDPRLVSTVRVFLAPEL